MGELTDDELAKMETMLRSGYNVSLYVPRLLAEVRRLRQENESLRSCLLECAELLHKHTGGTPFTNWAEDKRRLARADALLAGRPDPTTDPAREELERLRGIVDRLPKTADGVSMVPGGRYLAECKDRYDYDEQYELLEVIWWQGGGDDCFNPEYVLAESVRPWEFFDIGKVYSTKEAAEAAKENTNDRG